MDHVFSPPPPATVEIEGQGLLPIRRIFCIGRNYAAHATEMGNAVERDAPFFFTKSPVHAVGPGRWTYPQGTEDLHHEVELVVALGQGARMIAAGVGLDMTRRDLQAVAKDGRKPWDAGKDFEGGAVLAPMRPATAIGEVDISLTVNGETRQSGNTRDLLHPLDALLRHLGGLYTLAPGDLIMTGTPSGVGPVRPGDRLTGRIDGLPDLEIEIVA